MRGGIRRGRAPAVVNGVVAGGLVAVLAAFALVVTPPSPPGIAEFAPRATKPVSKAPPGQAALAGRAGKGSCGLGSPCASPSAITTPSGPNANDANPKVPRALQCYTWPDGSVTQTFDPQSPPCIAGWPEADKGNGGATAKGVTGTDVRVVALRSQEAALALARFFNSHFQLYGRRIQIVAAPKDASGQAVSAQGQRALAAEVSQLGAFAATTPDYQGSGSSLYAMPNYGTFIDSAAERHVITVDGAPYLATSAQAQRNAPYQWSYAPFLDTIEANLAEFTCHALAGRAAAHAGPSLQRTTRKFAALIAKDPQGLPPPDLSALKAGLAACRVSLQVYELEQDDTNPSANAQVFLQMERSGVTTAFLMAWGGQTTAMTRAPDAGYQPEWVLPGLNSQADPDYVSGVQAQQRGHVFGFDPQGKRLPSGSSPSQAAAREVGLARPDEGLYHRLLLLASGIQMAGPRLTPDTFAKGLWSTTFPNPGAAATPSFQATVGAEPEQFSLVSDIALIWWDASNADPSRTSELPGAGPGGFCYVGRGTRWSLGRWPSGDPGLFDRKKGC